MVVETLSGKAYFIVTGASRGIGKQIAVTFAPLLQKGSHILLLARDAKKLNETAESLPKHVTVHCKDIDLSTAPADELKEIIVTSVQIKLNEFQRVIVVHNVGTMGDIEKAANDLTDFDAWRKYYDLNVFSPAVLNGVVLQLFPKKDVKKVVINITSLMGLQATKYASYYCSGKAAREMFFKVFALENPGVDVLNYAPGPVETDMLDTVCKTIGDEEVRTRFNTMRDKKEILTTEQTVNRLLEVLKKHKYKSGDHVDYFDEL